jgi:hypothetical protein
VRNLRVVRNEIRSWNFDMWKLIHVAWVFALILAYWGAFWSERVFSLLGYLMV